MSCLDVLSAKLDALRIGVPIRQDGVRWPPCAIVERRSFRCGVFA